MRAAAGILIAVELANQIAPVVEQVRAGHHARDVQKFLSVIMWWQEKSVMPELHAVYDRWFDDDRVATQPGEIKKMVEQGELDYLALTRIEDQAQWDMFNIWMVQHVRNLDDYRALVPPADLWDAPLRWTGAWEIAKWEYRAAILEETLTGYELKETWRSHPRLDIIMHEVARQVLENTRTELASAWEKRQERLPGPSMSASGTHVSRPVLAYVRPVRRVRFKAGMSESDRRAYAVVTEKRVLDGDQYYDDKPVFYVLPPSAAPVDIDPDYLLVTGADFNTYARLVHVPSHWIEIVEVNGRNQRMVRYRSGNPSGQVLIRASAVEDF
jgi:hypothetical protein